MRNFLILMICSAGFILSAGCNDTTRPQASGANPDGASRPKPDENGSLPKSGAAPKGAMKPVAD